jgi:hypothetical protein
MDEEGAAASIDDEMLSAMSALLIADIDLLATMAHVRVAAKNGTEMKFTDMFLLLELQGRWVIVNESSSCLSARL